MQRIKSQIKNKDFKIDAPKEDKGDDSDNQSIKLVPLPTLDHDNLEGANLNAQTYFEDSANVSAGSDGDEE